MKDVRIRRAAMSGALIAALFVGVGVLTLRAHGRQPEGHRIHRTGSVGPWDTPDLPNPYPGAPAGSLLLPEPEGLTRLTTNRFQLPDGPEVELLGVSRSFQSSGGINFTSQDHTWKPNGAPLYGSDIATSYARQSALENKGARYLNFRFDSAVAGDIDVYGYVPDDAREGTPNKVFHGWDSPNRLDLFRGGPTLYRASVIVDDRTASHYMLALANGAWTHADSIRFAPTATSGEVARGAWGTLALIYPPKRSEIEMSISKSYLPYVTFQVDFENEPARFSCRLRLLDRSGKELSQSSRGFGNNQCIFPEGRLGDIDRIEIDTRPYRWYEFSGVHYDPDPTAWGSAYWGLEGSKTIKRSRQASLIGLIRPIYDGVTATPGPLLASDGKIWRDYPDPERVQQNPTTTGWQPGEPFIGLLHVNPKPNVPSYEIQIHSFASESSEPGKKLGAELFTNFWSGTNRPDCNVPFSRVGNAPYVQFEVRIASKPWEKVAEVPVPTAPMRRLAPEEVVAHQKVHSYEDVFSILVRPNGVAETRYLDPRKTWVGQPAVAHYSAKGEVRIVARLKGGARKVMSNNSALGDGTVGYDFYIDNDSEPLFEANGLKLRLHDIAAFEVETRTFGPPEYLVAKMPPAVSR